jgi:hypothetical protein
MATGETIVTIILPEESYSWEIDGAITKLALSYDGDWYSSAEPNTDGSRNINTLIPDIKVEDFKGAVFTMLATEYKILSAQIIER